MGKRSLLERGNRLWEILNLVEGSRFNHRLLNRYILRLLGVVVGIAMTTPTFIHIFTSDACIPWAIIALGVAGSLLVGHCLFEMGEDEEGKVL